MQDLYVTFVGGIEYIQVMLTNISKQQLTVEASYEPYVPNPKNPSLIPGNVIQVDLEPADESFLETLPSVFTFSSISPGVYSGYISYAPTGQGLPAKQKVTSNIYVTGPLPIGNPPGTHGHLISTRK